jgi:hypothetical protein
MMALRKSLRRGSAWVNHSISFRARESMLLADTDWTRSKELHHQILGLRNQAMAFLEPILAGGSVGLTAFPEAAGRGQIRPMELARTIGHTKHLLKLSYQPSSKQLIESLMKAYCQPPSNVLAKLPVPVAP